MEGDESERCSDCRLRWVAELGWRGEVGGEKG